MDDAVDDVVEDCALMDAVDYFSGGLFRRLLYINRETSWSEKAFVYSVALCVLPAPLYFFTTVQRRGCVISKRRRIVVSAMQVRENL